MDSGADHGIDLVEKKTGLKNIPDRKEENWAGN